MTLETLNLTKSFGGLCAVDGVSFTASTGELTCITGPNGAGKTTVFNVLSGFYTPQEGDVRFAGRSIRGRKPFEICRMGMARTFQNIRLSPHMSVLENVMVGCHVRRRCPWWMAPLGLPVYYREEQAIREFYGVQVLDDDGYWVRYRRFLYDEIAKKNGKSEFAAGLGLHHLLADGEARPQVGIFAADKTNADIIYQCAKYMVEHTALSQPAHRPLAWCRDSVREIRTRFGGIMKVYSSDADTKHGYSFSAILIDELHAQPNRRLWDVLTTGSDAARRQQAVIVLTTAGDDPDRKSIGWEIHEKCRRLLA